jgi:aminoglycoside phosphotransferase (APT) family kinase protein
MPETSDSIRFDLDVAALTSYLRDVVGRPVEPDGVTADLIAGGHSNLTYLVLGAGPDLVLRRPPVGAEGAGTHDIGREFRILNGVATTDVPVPAAVAYCADPAVIGAPFLLMDRVTGTIVRTREDAVALGPVGAVAACDGLIDTLSAIHRAELARSGLARIGRGVGYLERQVNRWVGSAAGLADCPEPLLVLADIVASQSLPSTSELSLVHGDFRIDNLVLDEEFGVRAVLDWEMGTIGDPLADVGQLLMYWGQQGDLEVSPEYMVTATPDFPSRQQLVSGYVDATGRSVERLGFYVLLAHLKMAVIVQRIVLRGRLGQTPDSRFDHLAQIPRALAERAVFAAAEFD